MQIAVGIAQDARDRFQPPNASAKGTDIQAAIVEPVAIAMEYTPAPKPGRRLT